MRRSECNCAEACEERRGHWEGDVVDCRRSCRCGRVEWFVDADGVGKSERRQVGKKRADEVR